MRKKILGTLAAILTAMSVYGVPAHREPGQVQQPDGRMLTVRLIGDEFYNYMQTLDGRVVMQTPGGYVYAQRGAGGELEASGVLAHDPSQRDASELSYVQQLEPGMVPSISADKEMMRSQQRQMVSGSKGLFNYNKFRGLVILVNYTDKKFSYTNAHEIFNDMVTKQNYDGFMNNKSIPTKEVYTGSVRDYFYDQSGGIFDPAFDVVGPVDIDVTCTYPNQTSNMATIVRKVIAAADSQVDFTKYDTDNDGYVDMFYIIFAGYGSNFSGNNSSYVWPHAWNVSSYSIIADGKRMGRYACSTELYGTPSSYCIDGIGTVCHEFSHVLGLMDEYDTDYSSGGGQSVDPGDWSVMAGGSYLNKARTPVGYSLFERYQSGFTVPKIIKGYGEYTLYDIDTCHNGYRINIPEQSKEYFLLENRRKTGSKWNCYGPGQGMLVFRVDSTNTTVWSSNKINSNPAHNYYELLRARYNGSSDSGSDPFPGTYNVNRLAYGGTPDFKSWAGLAPEFDLDSIWEKSGVVYFRIKPDNTWFKLEEFERMETSGKFDQKVPGTFTTWNFNNAWVEAESGSNNALAMMNKATCETDTIPHGYVVGVSFTAINKTSESVYFRLQAKVDGAYQTMSSVTGTTTASVIAGQTSTLKFRVPNLKNTSLMLTVTSGAKTAPVYIDDFRVTKDDPTAVEGIYDESSEGTLTAISTADGIMLHTVAGAAIAIYDMQGRHIASATADEAGMACINLPAKGIYVIASGGKALKFMY